MKLFLIIYWQNESLLREVQFTLAKTTPILKWQVNHILNREKQNLV